MRIVRKGVGKLAAMNPDIRTSAKKQLARETDVFMF
jgi:hypothetical protein